MCGRDCSVVSKPGTLWIYPVPKPGREWRHTLVLLSHILEERHTGVLLSHKLEESGDVWGRGWRALSTLLSTWCTGVPQETQQETAELKTVMSVPWISKGGLKIERPFSMCIGEAETETCSRSLSKLAGGLLLA